MLEMLPFEVIAYVKSSHVAKRVTRLDHMVTPKGFWFWVENRFASWFSRAIFSPFGLELLFPNEL